MNIQDIDNTYVAHTYGRFPITLVSGKGSILTDENGKEYIDMGSGIAVNSFGIADEEWAAAVTEQLTRLQHTSNLYYTGPCAMLAKTLCERTGLKKVFFGNSGAEANECAIKVARKYAADKYGADRHVIVTLKKSFHGRTLTTLAATGQDHFHELFQPLTTGFVHAEPNDIEDLQRIVSENQVAGILLECIQGEGGINPLENTYLQAVQKLADEQDILLMIDEVQTGNGRTGDLYAYMHAGIHPDVVTTAKGIGGGLPLGLCMIGEKAKDTLGPGDHGSTFGGNPVCCAGALSVLNRVDDALLADVRRKSEYIINTLRAVPGIESVTGRGLMLGILPKKLTAAEAVRECMNRGVICLTAKNKIRLLPALNISMELVEKAVAVIAEVCS